VSALFLVPVDPNLSPDLHLGRAHALKGSHPHESARNDALLAIKLNPTPAAYSTLATLFYMKEYAASVDAFDKCIQLQPPGETLGMFDREYLEKAEKALSEEEASLGDAGRLYAQTHAKQPAPVPKLPPRPTGRSPSHAQSVAPTTTVHATTTMDFWICVSLPQSFVRRLHSQRSNAFIGKLRRRRCPTAMQVMTIFHNHSSNPHREHTMQRNGLECYDVLL
jgi:tetratricopeptide (TPR) repeat protein